MFPLTFHLLRKCQKMSESTPKFLQKCCSSGFVMLPFYNIDLKKKSLCSRPGILCILQGDFQKSSHHEPTAFCSLWVVNKKNVHHATHRVSTKKNTGFQHRFALLKMKNTGVKYRFTLEKILCKMQKNILHFFALIGSTDYDYYFKNL